VSDESRYAASAGSDLRVGFDDDVEADERERIEQSVAEMVRQSVERRERQREVAASADALRAAAMAPLNKLIEADSAAMDAITSAAREKRGAGEVRPERLEFPVTRPNELLFDLAPGAHGLQVFAPPYDFLWHWHSGEPAPDLPMLDRPNGKIDVGHFTGIGADRQISHHAGFGVSLRTDHPRNVTGRSLRRTSRFYHVSSAGFGGSATAEGGMEMTVVENGQLLRFAEDKVFRSRVSEFESDTAVPDGFTTGDPVEVSWTMLPGSRYEFNVGAWVYCETQQPSLLPDNNQANAAVQALVLAMTLDVGS
jgi:hypothetical protein